jgi:thiol-disulfide isomerase/thioredoxin
MRVPLRQRVWVTQMMAIIRICIMTTLLSASWWMRKSSNTILVQASAVDKETSFMYGNDKKLYTKTHNNSHNLLFTEFGYLGQIEQHAPPPLVSALDRKNNNMYSFQEPESTVQPGTQFIVEFYNPWCGACQSYKKAYLELAKDVLEELEKEGESESSSDHKVYFYAVSCEAYMDVCQQMEIYGFPLVRYFTSDNDETAGRKGKTKADKGEPFEHTQLVKDYILDKVRTYTKEHTQTKSLATEAADAASDATTEYNTKAESSDDADAEVTINNHLNQVSLEVVASEDENASTTKSLTQLLTSSISAHDSDIIDDINLQRDTYLSVLYTLEYSVFTSRTGPLSAEKAHALHDWLELIHHSIPPRWTTLNALMENMLSKHFEATQSFDKLKQHATQLTPFVSDMPSTEGNWSKDCAHPQKSQSGYTCGLWKLFHTVSVGVARGAYQDAERRVRITTMAGAQGIRDMVDFFFGCLECRQHFLQMFDDCDDNNMFDRCNLLFDEDGAPYDDDPQWIEMALYFWKVHNHVNRRLYIEALELDNHALPSDTIIDDETAWPSVARCSGCRKADGSWSEKHVFLYVQTEYWCVASLLMNTAFFSPRLSYATRLETAACSIHRSFCGLNFFAFQFRSLQCSPTLPLILISNTNIYTIICNRGVTGTLASVEQHHDSGHTFASTGAKSKETAHKKVNKLGATSMVVNKASSSSSSIRSGSKIDDNTTSSSSSSALFRGMVFVALLLGLAFAVRSRQRSRALAFSAGVSRSRFGFQQRLLFSRR